MQSETSGVAVKAICFLFISALGGDIYAAVITTPTFRLAPPSPGNGDPLQISERRYAHTLTDGEFVTDDTLRDFLPADQQQQIDHVHNEVSSPFIGVNSSEIANEKSPTHELVNDGNDPELLSGEANSYITRQRRSAQQQVTQSSGLFTWSWVGDESRTSTTAPFTLRPLHVTQALNSTRIVNPLTTLFPSLNNPVISGESNYQHASNQLPPKFKYSSSYSENESTSNVHEVVEEKAEEQLNSSQRENVSTSDLEQDSVIMYNITSIDDNYTDSYANAKRVSLTSDINVTTTTEGEYFHNKGNDFFLRESESASDLNRNKDLRITQETPHKPSFISSDHETSVKEVKGSVVISHSLNFDAGDDLEKLFIVSHQDTEEDLEHEDIQSQDVLNKQQRNEYIQEESFPKDTYEVKTMNRDRISTPQKFLPNQYRPIVNEPSTLTLPDTPIYFLSNRPHDIKQDQSMYFNSGHLSQDYHETDDDYVKIESSVTKEESIHPITSSHSFHTSNSRVPMPILGFTDVMENFDKLTTDASAVHKFPDTSTSNASESANSEYGTVNAQLPLLIKMQVDTSMPMPNAQYTTISIDNPKPPDSITNDESDDSLNVSALKILDQLRDNFWGVNDSSLKSENDSLQNHRTEYMTEVITAGPETLHKISEHLAVNGQSNILVKPGPYSPENTWSLQESEVLAGDVASPTVELHLSGEIAPFAKEEIASLKPDLLLDAQLQLNEGNLTPGDVPGSIIQHLILHGENNPLPDSTTSSQMFLDTKSAVLGLPQVQTQSSLTDVSNKHQVADPSSSSASLNQTIWFNSPSTSSDESSSIHDLYKPQVLSSVLAMQSDLLRSSTPSSGDFMTVIPEYWNTYTTTTSAVPKIHVTQSNLVSEYMKYLLGLGNLAGKEKFNDLSTTVGNHNVTSVPFSTGDPHNQSETSHTFSSTNSHYESIHSSLDENKVSFQEHDLASFESPHGHDNSTSISNVYQDVVLPFPLSTSSEDAVSASTVGAEAFSTEKPVTLEGEVAQKNTNTLSSSTSLADSILNLEDKTESTNTLGSLESIPISNIYTPPKLNTACKDLGPASPLLQFYGLLIPHLKYLCKDSKIEGNESKNNNSSNTDNDPEYDFSSHNNSSRKPDSLTRQKISENLAHENFDNTDILSRVDIPISTYETTSSYTRVTTNTTAAPALHDSLDELLNKYANFSSSLMKLNFSNLLLSTPPNLVLKRPHIETTERMPPLETDLKKWWEPLKHFTSPPVLRNITKNYGVAATRTHDDTSVRTEKEMFGYPKEIDTNQQILKSIANKTDLLSVTETPEPSIVPPITSVVNSLNSSAVLMLETTTSGPESFTLISRPVSISQRTQSTPTTTLYSLRSETQSKVTVTPEYGSLMFNNSDVNEDVNSSLPDIPETALVATTSDYKSSHKQKAPAVSWLGFGWELSTETPSFLSDMSRSQIKSSNNESTQSTTQTSKPAISSIVEIKTLTSSENVIKNTTDLREADTTLVSQILLEGEQQNVMNATEKTPDVFQNYPTVFQIDESAEHLKFPVLQVTTSSEDLWDSLYRQWVSRSIPEISSTTDFPSSSNLATVTAKTLMANQSLPTPLPEEMSLTTSMKAIVTENITAFETAFSTKHKVSSLILSETPLGISPETKISTLIGQTKPQQEFDGVLGSLWEMMKEDMEISSEDKTDDDIGRLENYLSSEATHDHNQEANIQEAPPSTLPQFSTRAGLPFHNQRKSYVEHSTQQQRDPSTIQLSYSDAINIFTSTQGTGHAIFPTDSTNNPENTSANYPGADTLHTMKEKRLSTETTFGVNKNLRNDMRFTPTPGVLNDRHKDDIANVSVIRSFVRGITDRILGIPTVNNGKENNEKFRINLQNQMPKNKGSGNSEVSTRSPRPNFGNTVYPRWPTNTVSKAPALQHVSRIPPDSHHLLHNHRPYDAYKVSTSHRPVIIVKKKGGRVRIPVIPSADFSSFKNYRPMNFPGKSQQPVPLSEPGDRSSPLPSSSFSNRLGMLPGRGSPASSDMLEVNSENNVNFQHKHTMQSPQVKELGPQKSAGNKGSEVSKQRRKGCGAALLDRLEHLLGRELAVDQMGIGVYSAVVESMLSQDCGPPKKRAEEEGLLGEEEALDVSLPRPPDDLLSTLAPMKTLSTVLSSALSTLNPVSSGYPSVVITPSGYPKDQISPPSSTTAISPTMGMEGWLTLDDIRQQEEKDRKTIRDQLSHDMFVSSNQPLSDSSLTPIAEYLSAMPSPVPVIHSLTTTSSPPAVSISSPDTSTSTSPSLLRSSLHALASLSSSPDLYDSAISSSSTSSSSSVAPISLSPTTFTTAAAEEETPQASSASSASLVRSTLKPFIIYSSLPTSPVTPITKLSLASTPDSDVSFPVAFPRNERSADQAIPKTDNIHSKLIRRAVVGLAALNNIAVASAMPHQEETDEDVRSSEMLSDSLSRTLSTNVFGFEAILTGLVYLSFGIFLYQMIQRAVEAKAIGLPFTQGGGRNRRDSGTDGETVARNHAFLLQALEKVPNTASELALENLKAWELKEKRPSCLPLYLCRLNYFYHHHHQKHNNTTASFTSESLHLDNIISTEPQAILTSAISSLMELWSGRNMNGDLLSATWTGALGLPCSAEEIACFSPSPPLLG